MQRRAEGDQKMHVTGKSCSFAFRRLPDTGGQHMSPFSFSDGQTPVKVQVLFFKTIEGGNFRGRYLGQWHLGIRASTFGGVNT